MTGARCDRCRWRISSSTTWRTPAAIADPVALEAVEMTAFEDFVTEKVQEGRSILGLYPPTEEQSRRDFEQWRNAKGR